MPGDLYALLDVPSDVSPEDLRKAYKRAALRCHPDRKGGRTEDFQNLQRAYAILNDPSQRKLYDIYGEEMLTLMEGNGGPEVAAKVFARLPMTQRAQLVLIFFLATSFFMLTPIFIVLRWDAAVMWPWVICFVPLWVLHLMACIPVVLMPSPPDEMSPEEEEEWETAMTRQRAYRLAAVVIMGLLIALEVLVALRLDGSIAWSWHAVLAPWALLEFIAIIRKLAQAGQLGSEGVVPAVGWNLVRLGMAFTIGAKLNGAIEYWDLVFIPYFIGITINFLFLVRVCYSPDRTEEDALGFRMCGLVFMAMWITLLLRRLEEQSDISAFVVMLPLFVPPYLLCCCLSCAVFFAGERGEDESEDFENTSQVPLNPQGSAV